VQGVAGFTAGSRHAELYSSRDVDSPTILGFRSPRLLLPEWMVPALSESELQQIALHECEHLRRGDDWINLALQMGLILSPLNPALFWLNGRISVQRELAVDAAVVTQTARPLAYAACLTRLAEQRLERGRLRLALAAWERKSELVQRVQALLNPSSVWTHSQSAWATGVVAAASMVVVVGMMHVPQFVRVENEPLEMANTPTVIVPTIAAGSAGELIPVRNANGIPAARMVSASFQVPTALPIKVHAKRKKPANKTANSSRDLRALVLSVDDGPRLMRAHYVRMEERVSSASDPKLVAEPVRLVPATLSIPYVAVPTSNGWLLIEL
jgi:hypothetical protein